MPLPFILAGVAILAGGYGVKKGIDASSDFSEAKSTDRRARKLFEEAQEKLKLTRDSAQEAMEKAGKAKLTCYEKSLIPFVEAFSKIKNVDFKECSSWDAKLPTMTKESLREMKETVIAMQEVVGGGVSALGAGGLAGLATYGSVGLLGTASTGTAIGALSGAAATNATLAWLGGGSLAAGGFGMAGGMVVLGGIVTGPVLAIGGMMLASKAEAAKENAYENLAKARIEAEKLESACAVTEGISRRFNEASFLIQKLDEVFVPHLAFLQELANKAPLWLRLLRKAQVFVPHLAFLQKLANKGRDYANYSEQEKKRLFMAAAVATTIKNIIDTPLLSDEGTPTAESRKILSETMKKLNSGEFAS